MTCNCNNTTVTPCTNTSGCVVSTYGKCVFYSGDDLTCGGSTIISNGDTIDVALEAINDRICNLTPADLDWSSFDYSSLGSWTTAQEFAEGIAALVSDSIEGTVTVPTISIPGACSVLFDALTPGTSTLLEILNEYASIICDLNVFNTDGTVTAGCFTAVPTATKLSDWISWIKNNVCSIRTEILAITTDIDGRLESVEDFLGDLSLIDNSDCLAGSATDTVQQTIALVKTKLCELDSTVGAYPDFSALTLSWGACVGLYPSYTGVNATASLTTQLGRLLSEISKRTVTFSGDFSTSSTACGTSVSLAVSPTPFACSDLEDCSIHNIGDVDPTLLGTGSGDKFKVFSWSTTNETWYPKPLTVTSTGGSASITSTDDGTSINYNIAVTIADGGNTSDNTLLTPVDLVVGSPSGGSTSLTLKYNPDYMGVPIQGTFTYNGSSAASSYLSIPAPVQPQTIKINNLARLGVNIDYTVGGGGLAVNAQAAIGTVDATLTPAITQYMPVNITETTTYATVPAVLVIDTIGTVYIKNVGGSGLVAAEVYCVPAQNLMFYVI